MPCTNQRPKEEGSTCNCKSAMLAGRTHDSHLQAVKAVIERQCHTSAPTRSRRIVVKSTSEASESSIACWYESEWLTSCSTKKCNTLFDLLPSSIPGPLPDRILLMSLWLSHLRAGIARKEAFCKDQLVSKYININRHYKYHLHDVIQANLLRFFSCVTLYDTRNPHLTL